MITPNITILKKNAIVESAAHTTIRKAVKRLKIPRFNLRRSTKPFLYTASGWTDKSPHERLHLRASELALLAGHGLINVTRGEYEQAKREVTGETILSRQNAVLNAVLRCSV